MYKSNEIASLIINYSKMVNYPINHSQLQQLLYTAYGNFYKHKDEILFDDDIIATMYGPVIESVKNRFIKLGPYETIPIQFIEEYSYDPTIRNDIYGLVEYYKGLNKLEFSNHIYNERGPYMTAVTRREKAINKEYFKECNFF